MPLDDDLRDGLVLPAICAPMFLVSGPDLVRAACQAGIMAGFPRHNARTFETFARWLGDIRGGLDQYAADHPGARTGPLAVNLSTRMEPAELDEHLRLCVRHGVKVIISAAGDPTELTKRVHGHGLRVFHDVTTLRFAEKAAAAGVDGMTCIGAGGGGKSGTISHLVFVPKVRQMFGGTIICAGAVATGAAIRAAELLGADLAYLGTRFIATRESLADPRHKKMLTEAGSSDLRYTGAIGGIPANWLAESMRGAGVDPDDPPTELPPGAKPWKTVWSAGQGVDLIDDVPSVADTVLRLRREYAAACATPDMADVARVLNRVEDAGKP
ncbi:MAG: nitronate monooxygenase [Streptosporangiales bacterium]|nr:nitronate monooxygenase [Streptosporangiales bacterium]